MKKIISGAVAVIAIATALSVGISADGWSDEVTCTASYGTPVIDGKVDEWAKVDPLTITLDDPIVKQYGAYQGNWESAAKRDSKDFSTEIRYMWDENNLYIYEKRIDDDTELTGKSDEPWATATTRRADR